MKHYSTLLVFVFKNLQKLAIGNTFCLNVVAHAVIIFVVLFLNI